MNYYQIPNDPRNTLLNALKDQKNKKTKNEEKNKTFFEKELYVGPLEMARRKKQAGQTIDSVNEQPEIEKPTIPVMATSNQNQSDGLLSEKDEKEVEERLNKDIERKSKYTKAGNFFAKVGGFNLPAPTQEQIEQATPEQLDYFNKQRLAARNKGVGEMLLLLSDALGGRDIAGRAIERQQARQPKEKTINQIRSSLVQKVMQGQKLSQTELNTLIAIDPSYGDLVYTNPELFSDLQIEPQQSITKEDYDKLNDGDKFIFDGVEYTKGE